MNCGRFLHYCSCPTIRDWIAVYPAFYVKSTGSLFLLLPLLHFFKISRLLNRKKQGRIHGRTVADGWAGAVMQKPLAIQKCDVPTYRPTYRPTDTARCRVACPRLKIIKSLMGQQLVCLIDGHVLIAGAINSPKSDLTDPVSDHSDPV